MLTTFTLRMLSLEEFNQSPLENFTAHMNNYLQVIQIKCAKDGDCAATVILVIIEELNLDWN